MTNSIYQSAEESRNADVAYHLIADPVWEASQGDDHYQPEAYDADGFIHLTLGIEPLLEVANRFYTSDPRPFSVLVLDLSKVVAPIRYEDPDQIYPHIYGLLNTNAVIGTLRAGRNDSGEFISFTS